MQYLFCGNQRIRYTYSLIAVRQMSVGVLSTSYQQKNGETSQIKCVYVVINFEAIFHGRWEQICCFLYYTTFLAKNRVLEQNALLKEWNAELCCKKAFLTFFIRKKTAPFHKGALILYLYRSVGVLDMSQNLSFHRKRGQCFFGKIEIRASYSHIMSVASEKQRITRFGNLF